MTFKQSEQSEQFFWLNFDEKTFRLVHLKALKALKARNMVEV